MGCALAVDAVYGVHVATIWVVAFMVSYLLLTERYKWSAWLSTIVLADLILVFANVMECPLTTLQKSIQKNCDDVQRESVLIKDARPWWPFAAGVAVALT